MVARNVVVQKLRTTNPFRSRFDSGHRQIGDFSWFESSNEGYFFDFFGIRIKYANKNIYHLCW